MSIFHRIRKFPLTVFLIVNTILVISGQNTSPDSDVLKINTSLIRAGVSVFDKGEKPVRGLKSTDFILKVDGKAIDSFFFDQIGVKNNGRQPSKQNEAEDSPKATSETLRATPGRAIAFVIDDLHLSQQSVLLARKMVQKFIDQQKLPTDNIAIISTGGSTGFLSQFSDELVMQNAALQRIIYSPHSGADTSPPISEYEARSIERMDHDITDFVARRTMSHTVDPSAMESSVQELRAAEAYIQSRARAILEYTRKITGATFDSIEETIRQCRLYEGRKAVYFISDGFLLDSGNSDASYRLDRITNLAVRSNTVIYTYDAKGLDASRFQDASDLSSPFRDPGVSSAPRGGDNLTAYSIKAREAFENQDALSNIAKNTGGQFIHNTNDFPLARLADEAFTSYMLSWEPEIEGDRPRKFHKIEVSVKERPDLKVRVQSGYLETSSDDRSAASAEPQMPSLKVGISEETTLLVRAARSTSPKTDVPTSLSLKFLHVEKEASSLWATIQLSANALTFTESKKQSSSNVDIAGLIYNTDGRLEKSFKAPLTINVLTKELLNGNARYFNFEYNTPLKPGLYQMRVSSLDRASGKTGSYSRWIEIPDISSQKLTLSSLILAEKRFVETEKDAAKSRGTTGTWDKNIGNRFDKASRFSYAGFVYNSSEEPEQNLTVKTQLIQNGQTVYEGAPSFVSLGTDDEARIPFIGEIDISKLQPGFYELKVTATDKTTKSPIVRQVLIEIY